jgi:hypothetical protein
MRRLRWSHIGTRTMIECKHGGTQTPAQTGVVGRGLMHASPNEGSNDHHLVHLPGALEDCCVDCIKAQDGREQAPAKISKPSLATSPMMSCSSNGIQIGCATAA